MSCWMRYEDRSSSWRVRWKLSRATALQTNTRASVPPTSMAASWATLSLAMYSPWSMARKADSRAVWMTHWTSVSLAAAMNNSYKCRRSFNDWSDCAKHRSDDGLHDWISRSHCLLIVIAIILHLFFYSRSSWTPKMWLFDSWRRSSIPAIDQLLVPRTLANDSMMLSFRFVTASVSIIWFPPHFPPRTTDGVSNRSDMCLQHITICCWSPA